MILAKPFVTQNWAKEDQPRRVAHSQSRYQIRPRKAARRCARILAAEQISFRPPRCTRPSGVFFVNSREDVRDLLLLARAVSSRRAGPIGRHVRARSIRRITGALRAIDPLTGERKWEFRYPSDLRRPRVCRPRQGSCSRVTAMATSSRSTRRRARISGITQLGNGLKSTGGTTYMVDGSRTCWCHRAAR